MTNFKNSEKLNLKIERTIYKFVKFKDNQKQFLCEMTIIIITEMDTVL